MSTAPCRQRHNITHASQKFLFLSIHSRSLRMAPTMPLSTRSESSTVIQGIQTSNIAYSGTQDPQNSTTLFRVRIVVQRHRQHFFLLSRTLSPSASGRMVMQGLRRLSEEDASRRKLLRPLRKLLWTTSIELATLSTFRQLDPESPCRQPLEVIVSQRSHSSELTAAFHQPWLLQSTIPFAHQYPALLSTSQPQRVLLLGQTLDKRAICWILLAVVLLSLVSGLVVGFVSSRADLAIAVTAGLTGMISIFTGLLVWVLK